VFAGHERNLEQRKLILHAARLIKICQLERIENKGSNGFYFSAFLVKEQLFDAGSSSDRSLQEDFSPEV